MLAQVLICEREIMKKLLFTILCNCLFASCINAKSHEELYSIHILDFYTPVLSEAENSQFFENLMDHLKVYAVYCTQDNAPKSALRKEKEYISRGHSHIPSLDLKDIFKKKTKTEYYKKCQAKEISPKSTDKNFIQLGSIQDYKYYDFIGFQIEIEPSFMSQYTLLNNTDPDPIMRSIQREGAQKGDYYFLVGKAERFFLLIQAVNHIHKAEYIKDVKKSYRGEELLKSVGLSQAPIAIIAIVTDEQHAQPLDLTEKFDINDKLALIDNISYDEMHKKVDLKNSFNIHDNSTVSGTYVKTPDVQVLHLNGKIDKDSDWTKIEVNLYETWRSYKGNVVVISGNLESRSRFDCKVNYQLRFNPNGTSNKTFNVYTGYDVLKPYDGTEENIKNMKEIIQQYRYTQANDPLNECGKVIEYMQTIFSSSQKELSKKMQEMGDITYTRNTEQRKEQYLSWEKHPN